MKRNFDDLEDDLSRSLPTRERGLKPFISLIFFPILYVAPYAGAWIETAWNAGFLLAWFVAPYAGAWIETFSLSSQPMGFLVAPYAGAWIETQVETTQWYSHVSSLPTRERGLKH